MAWDMVIFYGVELLLDIIPVMNGNITWDVYSIIYSKYNQQCDIKIYQVGWAQNDSIRGNMGSSPMTMRIH